MTGEVVALDEAMRQRMAEADDEDRQFGLFGAPLTPGGQNKAIVLGRGPGRPPGARNRRTERSVQFLLARHRDPREVLLEIAEANVHDLAALYGCTPHEAAAEKRLAAAAVLPYVAARLPLAVDVTERKIVHLTIVDQPADQLAAGGIGAVAALVDDIEYRQLTERPSADIEDGSDG